jgi:hypothetical protein
MPEQIVLGPIPKSATPLNEAALMQNAALGAILIWRFAKAYAGDGHRPCLLPLCFLPLPILFHHASRDAAIGTYPSSGLNKFAAKFDKNREELLSIHDRMLALRSQTLRSLALAATQRLVIVSCEDASVRSIQTRATPQSTPERVRPMIRAAEKLGLWCAAMDIREIANTLRVAF